MKTDPARELPTPADAPGPLPARVRVPLGRQLRQIVRGPGQLVVWLAVGAMGIWLVTLPQPPADAVGVARGDSATLVFDRAGRIAELLIPAEVDVTAGSPLARLDDTLHEARINEALENVAALVADLESLAADRARRRAERSLEAATLETDDVEDSVANRSRVRDEMWRLEIEARERRLAALAVEVEIDTDRLLADQIRVRQGRIVPLTEQGFARRADVQDLGLEEKTVLGRVAANERLLAAIREEVAVAEQQLASVRAIVEQLERPTGTEEAWTFLESAAAEADRAALDALERRIAARRAEVNALRLERERLVLVAPFDGFVSSVHARADQLVTAGAPVLEFRGRSARDVVVYLAEPTSPESPLPATVELARRSAPSAGVAADVVGAGTGVQAVPERFWSRPGVPEYGRTLVVQAPEELRLLPGEAVTVRLIERQL